MPTPPSPSDRRLPSHLANSRYRVLVLGSGGREHALAWALARAPSVGEVIAAPGNGGTALEPGVRNVYVDVSDGAAVARLAREVEADLVVVGPEDPLAAGVVDLLSAEGILAFGPTQAAARIESSKSWARAFMGRHGISQPEFKVVDGVEAGEAAIRRLGGRCVVKADGLAAGKGVVVAVDEASALSAMKAMLSEGRFGAAGSRVVIEELLEGEELSVIVITDGQRYLTLPPAQDHKRLLDGDEGPNTGGMGAYAPAPAGSSELLAKVRAAIIEPALAGLAEEGAPFRGCLYAGLMLTARGPVVVEFNSRFGDPETQVQLPLVKSDLAEVLLAAARGDLGGTALEVETRASCLGVVLASGGYPGSYETGVEVAGLDLADRTEGVKVFHAGTAIKDGAVITTGGRVLNVTATKPNLAEAAAAAYGAIGATGVSFPGMHYRRDVAFRALAPHSV